MRTLPVAVIIAVASLSSATAQQPTVPATLDFTCHGYDEGATRAYNCIPAAGQESSMPTFVPPAGSTCNGGRIDEFPAGRLGLPDTMPRDTRRTVAKRVVEIGSRAEFLHQAH